MRAHAASNWILGCELFDKNCRYFGMRFALINFVIGGFWFERIRLIPMHAKVTISMLFESKSSANLLKSSIYTNKHDIRSLRSHLETNPVCFLNELLRRDLVNVFDRLIDLDRKEGTFDFYVKYRFLLQSYRLSRIL